MSEAYPVSQPRAILNANKGVSNVIEYKIIKTDLQNVTKKLFNILKHHYGPYSGFAAIDDGQPLNETLFTKDGIGIIRSVEFASPQEEWVRKTISYIGTKMETSVGDGTTSAMMFTCAMMKHMSEHIHELRPVSYNSFRNGFNDFVDTVREKIRSNYVYSPKTKRLNNDKWVDVIQKSNVFNIVHSQVYTSSHGDRNLAKVLAEMYSNVPEEQWERMTYERRRYESDKQYEVVQSEGQYQMNADVMTSSMLNKDLCTWYEAENATVIIMNDGWRTSSPDWDTIMSTIDNGSKEKPVVVICHTVMDRDSYQQINEKIVECDKAGKPFAVFTNKPEHPKVNDFTALQTIIGVDITKYGNGESVIVDGVRVKFKNKRLSLDGIVKIPDGYTENERHQVTDGKHSQFTDVLEAWKEQANWYSKQADDRDSRNWANYFNRMYVKLRYNKTYTVVVGGKAYDNAAFVDVLDDAIKAASRALTNGATFGNNRALYLVVEEMLETAKKRNRNPRWKYPLWFAQRVKESLEDIAGVVVSRIHPNNFIVGLKKRDFVNWWFHHTVDLLQYDPHPIAQNWFNPVPWKNQAPLLFKNVGRVKSMYPYFENGDIICQPANSDITMLERFGEIALKFILTERVIIHGGAYVSKKGK